MNLYTKSIKDDLAGVVPDLRDVKRAIKAHPDIKAIVNTYGNNGDTVWILFTQDLTLEQVAVLDSIFVPGHYEAEVSVDYMTSNVFVDARGTKISLATIDLEQELTNKTLIDPTNNVLAQGLLVNGGSVSSSGSAVPTPGQVLVATSSSAIGFQNLPNDAFLSTLSGSQTIPAQVATPLQFDSDIFNTGIYDNTIPRVTIAKKGVYDVDVSVYRSGFGIGSAPVDSIVYLMLYVNGVIVNSQASIVSGTAESHKLSLSREFNQGDNVQAMIYSSSGSLDLKGNETVDTLAITGLSYWSMSLVSTS